ncbi:sugar-binding domain-containing protein [Lachnoclostridium sp. An181]|uniref:sugar-binding domain-containing protein n=1 Tax=Lachnoclostridium sp. An181 TaxID=1965575 RepID=UPI000B571AA2|nr:sugar-binding domain-containing protein [Lachnoclostridium sp. An181]OUP48818.1 beta-galactosidase [Lachnoclostridium sp. An181]
MKKMKKTAASLMAVVLAAGCAVPVNVLASDTLVKVMSDSENQMSSEPEVVYVNSYNGEQRSQNFDSNWKFYLGDAGSAQEPGFDDSKWRNVDLPHDYSIEQEYSKSMEAESGYLPGGTGWYRKNFTVPKNMEGKRVRIDFGGVYMNSTVWVNGQELGTHPYGYTGFSFDITDYVNFGEENTIAVKVDHKTPSSRWYSGSGIYRSVDLTITDPVHVDLNGTKIETNNLESQAGGAVDMDIRTTVANDSDNVQKVTLTHTVFKKGADVEENIGTVTTDSKEVAAGQSADITAVLQAQNPELWSTDNPALYTVRTEVKVDGAVVDTYDTEYGFRYFNFDSSTGFSLNGQNVKLKGVCMHHDQGALGAEANARAIERQVEILKEMGCNSIRVTHNPAADELIEACNEHGILVIDEAFDGWFQAKNGNTQDYAKWFNEVIADDNQIIGAEKNMTWAQFDLAAMIERGQNDPSIIMWSLGNEVMEGVSGPFTDYPAVAQQLINWAKDIDDTRAITTGDNKQKANWTEAHKIGASLDAAGGTVGFNYCNGGQLDSWHSQYPDWKMYGSETASSINSRGIYNRINGGSQTSDGNLTSYDNSCVGWGALASDAWYTVIQRDYVAGEYVWTGFDYIGEPTPWNGTGPGGQTSNWPKNSYFGIVDTAGFPKDTYYFYQSQWNDDVNTLHILPAWNEDVVYKDGSGKVPVVVYSDAKAVELFFVDEDGTRTSLGKKEFTTKETGAGYTYQIYEGQGASATQHKNMYLTWNVPYEDGTLEAVAYDENGDVIENTEGRNFVTTTGDEARLDAYADRTEITADGKDLAYITVDVTDEEGNIVPDAANRVKFTVEGEGKLVGVDNGKQSDHESYLLDNRCAFSGKVLAIVQATDKAGDIKVTATADGLTTDVVEITTKQSEEGTVPEKAVDSFKMAKNYYVKTNNMPQLPAEIDVNYTDGSTGKTKVTWDTIAEDLILKVGTFKVNGTTEDGYSVSVTINMIDDVGALLNYSTTTRVGNAPVLPDSRPAVMPDGQVLSASFTVDWQLPDDSVYNEEGIVTINGTANVLGQAVKVTATVRVQEETITIGNNVAPSVMNLTQNIPAESQSDTLNAIVDGSTEIDDNMDGGPNESAWSNWQYSQEGHNKAEITFEYATQQRIGQMDIFFWKDSASARYPDAGTTEIYVSDTGAEDSWVKVDAKETIGAENGRVKEYTYEFTPVTATFIKICVTNKDEVLSGGKKPCTGITEVQIYEATGSFTTNTTAELSKLVVDGTEVSQNALDAGVYNTPATRVENVEAQTKDNASVTVLPAYEGAVKLILESEDHNTQNVFTINLGAEETENPADDSRDYPVEKLTATAGSEHPGTVEGPASNVLDKNYTTLWHTNWSTLPGKDKFWITLELDEETKLDALRYYGRDGSINGHVGDYKVEVSTDNATWTEVSKGTWENTAGWKLAVFNEPVTAKYVRLTGLSTFGDSGNNKFMSAAEMRVRMAKETIDISDEANNIQAEVDPNPVITDIVDADHPATPDVILTKDGAALRNGIDYVVSYENNIAYGTATAVVKGIQKYSGTIRVDFEIKAAEDPEPSGDISTAVLEYALGLAKDADTTGVITSVVERFEALKQEAQNILDRAAAGDETLTQEMVDQTWKDLINIMQYLSFKQGNKEDLQKVIDMASTLDLTKYLEEGQKAFTDALAAANEVNADGDAMQDEVNTAWRNLLQVMSELRLKPSKDALEALIASAETVSLANVAKADAEMFRTALADAKSVYENEQATEEEVTTAVDTLQAAIDKVAAVNTEDKNTANDADKAGTSDKVANAAGTDNQKDVKDTSTSDAAKTSSQKSAKTGDTANAAGAAAAMLAAGAAAVVVFRRKRN